MSTVQEVEASGSLLHHNMNPEVKTEEQDSVDPKPGEGRTHFLNFGKSKEEPKHNVKEEPEENPSKNWDAQLQEFLKTLQGPQGRREGSQFLEPKLWNGPKLSRMSSQGGMDTSKWSEEMWISQIETHLVGTTQDDWDTLLDVAHGGKEKIGDLAEEAIRVETRCHPFRTLSYEEAKGPRDFCQQLQELCREWLKPEKRTKEQILDLVTLEQFLFALPLDMQNWLRKYGPETCAHAVSLSEEFLLKRQEAQTWERQELHKKSLHGIQERNISAQGNLKIKMTEMSEEDIGKMLKSNQLLSEPPKDEDFRMSKPESDGSQNLSIGWLNEDGESKLMNSERREPLRMFLKAAIESDLPVFKENNGSHDAAPRQNGSDVRKGVGQLVQPQSVCPGFRGPAVQEEEEINNKGSGEGAQQSSQITTTESPDAEEKLFRCWHCGKNFGNSSHLLTHERTHVGEKLYKCSHCGESERIHKGQKPHKCSHCGQTFDSHAHEEISAEEKPYVCAECGESCSQKSDLLKHQRTHPGEKPYKCSVCGENFRNESSLIVHQRIHTGEKPYVCLYCGKCFSRRSHFLSHERIHTTLCSHCGKSFSQKSELLEHKKTHLEEDLLACFACGKIFERSSELLAHVQTHQEKLFECSACGKKFRNSLQRLAHQKVHTGEKPHKCSHCTKSFSQRHSLIAHERIHTGEKPHKCLVCGKNFRSISDLKSHERTHRGEKPYRCSHCDKSFRWSSHLLSHKRIHTGEKPYLCSDCGRTFDKRSSLLVHVRIHTGQRPYVCTDCGKSFFFSSVLLRHQKVHVGEDVARWLEHGKGFGQHGDQAEKVSKCPECTQGPSLSLDLEHAQMQLKGKRFECPLCSKTFKNSSHLRMHQSVHTKVQPSQCLDCGRNVIRKPNLIAPLKKLSGQTPGKCSECEKRLNLILGGKR
ncbi:zinc finger and SCAN domain-containing protein 2-like isoform X2 [Crotalus tigris]|uniref:zinc finger and SCAN domain-containing protein 2-like isoform X2 n=1 Tax=Crotalus tigris TaxID=88082 RepID=UPI00192FA4BE|nr:zinc finger and SCAN domain-containing protein 2-like isoform X2 [Crotalus tigris]